MNGNLAQVFEIRIYPAHESVRSIRATFFDVTMDPKRSSFALSERTTRIPTHYLIFKVRASRKNSSKFHFDTRPAATSSRPSATCSLSTRNFSRLLESICDRRLPHLFGKQIKRFGGLLCRRFHPRILASLPRKCQCRHGSSVPGTLHRHGALSTIACSQFWPSNGCGLRRCKVDAVEAAHVDVDLVRVRARHVERMNAASGAEGMLRRAGVER